jgi:hypothetical protein
MRIAGPKTRAMMAAYAGDLAIERAGSAHAQLPPGDRLRASYPHKPILEGTWVT